MSTKFHVAFLIASAVTAALFAQEERAVIRAYQTTSAPEVDGVISDGEWDAAGPPIVVSAEDGGTAFEDDPFGGPSDLSYQFRVMWEEPWVAYFLFEVTDDIAMEFAPANAWEADQVEFFMDGNDLEGNDDLPTFQWWDNEETYGKFGSGRFEGLFEGNGAKMSTFIEDLYEDEFGATAISMVTETGENGNYIVEYAVSLEPMFDDGTFDGTPTGDAGEIVIDETAVKWTVCVSDDDNFGDGTVGRSHTLCSYRAAPDADWRDSTAFSDLVFVGEYVEDGGVDGDFNGSGARDVADLELLADAMATNDLAFDLNSDGTVDYGDRQYWVETLSNTFIGDSDLNGEFNSSDFVAVFSAAKYETGAEATWAEGDWNGDKVFDSSDFVPAFQGAGYENGARDGGLQTVPEPSAIGLLMMGSIAMLSFRKRR